MTRVEGITAFLIHSRDYQNNSKLLDFLTDEFGKIRLLAKGVKYTKTKIQPFLRLKISFSGKSDLKSLTHWEIDDMPRYFTGRNLFLLMYINELISKLVTSDPLNLCADYLYLLEHLENDNKNNEWQLRLFENQLLEQMGYGVDFFYDINGDKISTNQVYVFTHNQGFMLSEIDSAYDMTGHQLTLIAKKIMPDDKLMTVYKKINRIRIEYLLNGRTLESRKLFISPIEN